MQNETPKPSGTRMIGPVPLVPAIIILIWLVMFVVNITVGLPHKVSLPIVVATIIWFIIWFIRLVVQSAKKDAND
jgi:hypothetical protein